MGRILKTTIEKSQLNHTENEPTEKMANFQTFPTEMIDRQVQLPQTVNAFYLEPPQIILTSYPTITEHHIITTAICWILGKIPPSIKRKIVAIPDNMKVTFNQTIAPEFSNQVITFLGMAGLITLNRITDKGSTAKLKNYLNRWQALCTNIGIEDIFATNKIPRKQVAKFVRILESWQLWAAQQTNMRWHLLEMAMQEPDVNNPELVKQALLQVQMDHEDFTLWIKDLINPFIDSRNQIIRLPTSAQGIAELTKVINELVIILGHQGEYYNIIVRCKR